MEEKIDFSKFSKEELIDLLNKQEKYYIEKLKAKPSALQIIAFGMSCLALGISLAKLLIK